jgi:uncharacterized membrane protein
MRKVPATNPQEFSSLPLESLLAGVLHHGSWVASVVIAVGLVLTAITSPTGTYNLHLVTIGIALFLLLPVLRVVLMLIAFLRQRDYPFSAIAGLVLTIILVGFVLGMRVPSAIAR